MDSAPPSYEEATLADVLTIIAPYIHTPDLCASILVSKRFQKSISPRLWGNPALYIGLEHDGIDDRLARFQRTLAYARAETRCMVHTIQLPSSKSLYFDDRPSHWLVDLLRRLPNLQALIVAGILFFDHAALLALGSTVVTGNEGPKSTIKAQLSGHSSTPRLQRTVSTPISGARVKLLHASGCANLTAASLAQALPSFASLLYLDLSHCPAAKYPNVLQSFASLWQLKILRLRGIGLTNEGCSVLANTIARRVASLDVSNNFLTDAAIRILMQSCIGSTPNYDYTSQISTMRPADLRIYRSTAMESSVWASLTSNLVNRLAIEDLGDQGVTHMYLANNPISAASTQALLNHRALYVLDAGNTAGLDVDTALESSSLADSTMVHLRVPFGYLFNHSSVNNKKASLSFQPALYPRLRRLILTGFPAFSKNDEMVSTIIWLIQHCAVEAQRARRQAGQDYATVPGQLGLSRAVQSAAVAIFALQTIVLEIAPAGKAPVSTAVEQPVISDTDIDGLWRAAESDFSFFEEEKIAIAGSTGPSTIQRQKTAALEQEEAQGNAVDNLALLAAFRRQRKAAHERDMLGLGPNCGTPGYWEGTIEIIRP